MPFVAPRAALSAASRSGLVARGGSVSELSAGRFGSANVGAVRLYASAAPTVVSTPAMGDSITSGTIATWEKRVGDFVGADELIATVETDKVVIEIRAPTAGKLVQCFVEAGGKADVGSPLYALDTSATAPAGGAAAAPAPKAASAPVAKTAAGAGAPAAPAAPAVKFAAAPAAGGVKTAAPVAAAPAPKAAAPAAPSAPKAPAGSRTETRVAMTRMRKRIAERLKGSQNTYAMVTTFQEVDMHELVAMRNVYKDAFAAKHGVKLGFMSAFVKAASAALQRQPVVNAVIDGENIVYRDYVDISVAVASPTGLVVPVLRNVEGMSFADVEKTLGEYSTRAKNNQLNMEDMTGGTFTISNGGVFGSLFGTPIINPPQSAILGMHATNDRAVVVKGQIVIRPVMYLALTYDHRLIDGREGVTFLKSIKTAIEDPRSLLLDI